MAEWCRIRTQARGVTCVTQPRDHSKNKANKVAPQWLIFYFEKAVLYSEAKKVTAVDFKSETFPRRRRRNVRFEIVEMIRIVWIEIRISKLNFFTRSRIAPHPSPFRSFSWQVRLLLDKFSLLFTLPAFVRNAIIRLQPEEELHLKLPTRWRHIYWKPEC